MVTDIDARKSVGVYGYAAPEGATPNVVAAVNPAACPPRVDAATVTTVLELMLNGAGFPYLSVVLTAMFAPVIKLVVVMLIWCVLSYPLTSIAS